MALSLQSRYGLALLAVVVALVVVFTTAMAFFVEVLERELLHDTLTREVAEYRDLLARDPTWPGIAGENPTRIVVRRDELASLPRPLADIGPNLEGEIELEGREYLVKATDVGDRRLIVLLDIAPVEKVEDNLVTAAALTTLAGAVLATLLGIALGQRALRPVTALADDVRQLEPDRPPPALGARHTAAEVHPIATAIDQLLGRFRGQLDRERAYSGDVSHELRTPITIIRSASELLLAQPDLGPQARTHAARILRAAERMQLTTTGLLLLARDDASEDWPTSSLASLASEALEMFEETAAARGLALELAVDADRTLRAPPALVVCIVQNLVANAIAASENGTITVSVAPHGIAVQDNGRGMDPAELPRIFERGYRGSRSDGAGLGLDIVRRLVEKLGAELTVSQRPQGGTRFLVSLPPTDADPSQPPTASRPA
jgi:signal transduction histidine kinase